MIVLRTETHIIKESNPIYDWILEECSRSRNLYNKTLFIYRQAFTGNHDKIEEFKPIIRHEKFISSFELVKQMAKLKDVDYYAMTKKNSGTQIINNPINWIKFLNKINQLNHIFNSLSKSFRLNKNIQSL